MLAFSNFANCDVFLIVFSKKLKCDGCTACTALRSEFTVTVVCTGVAPALSFIFTKFVLFVRPKTSSAGRLLGRLLLETTFTGRLLLGNVCSCLLLVTGTNAIRGARIRGARKIIRIKNDVRRVKFLFLL